MSETFFPSSNPAMEEQIQNLIDAARDARTNTRCLLAAISPMVAEMPIRNNREAMLRMCAAAGAIALAEIMAAREGWTE